MLKEAKKFLQKIMDQFRQEIRDGIPIIVLEPSCAAVFKDELLNLFPHDDDAKRLSQNVIFFSDFVEKHAESFSIPKLNRHALLHQHCHQRAALKTKSDVALLKMMGITYDTPDSGCCGMAGAFGYEKNHYNISVSAGERILLPAVRRLKEDSLIITNGFSCMEQIQQMTGRRAIHMAEILELAFQQAPTTKILLKPAIK